MRSNRPQGAASNPRGHRVRAGLVRVLSVTAVAATACAMMAGAASAATAAPAAGTTKTTTTITTASPGTVDAGKPFTIAVKVTGAGGTPSGTVTIAPTATLPASYSCIATLAGGVGSCAVTPGAGTFGDVDYVATYSGDATFAASASTGTFELIVPETTTTSVSPATASPGSVTLTAIVVGQDKGNISPSAGGTGSVTFYNGGAVISTACAAVSLTYNGGGANLATCKTPTLAAGTYTITAKYSGDPNNLASSGTEKLTVKAPPPVKHATKTHGWAKPASTKLHRVVTLWATVTSPGRTPGGKVTFMWRGHVVCSARLSHGKAHCSIEFLKTGTYRIRAWYAGNSTFDRSHSAFFAVTVKK
jgi:Bacterial Ig-like domain (group 3)